MLLNINDPESDFAVNEGEGRIEISALLKEARAVITPIERWGRHHLFQFNNGRGAEVDTAARFCAVGALYRAHWDHTGTIYGNAVIEAQSVLGECARELSNKSSSVINFNDRRIKREHGHKQVLAMYDCAIARTESTK